jgi:Flp pilus assembly protein TadD
LGRRNQALILLLLAAATAIVAIAGWRRYARSLSADQFVFAVRQALDRDLKDEARRLAEQAVARYPGVAKVRLAAADVEFASGFSDRALAHLQSIDDDGSDAALNVQGAAGDMLFRLNRLSAAEAQFRLVLQRNPDNLAGQQRLALVLAMTGQRSKAASVLFEIVKGGRFDTQHLALFGEPDQFLGNPEYVNRFENPLENDSGLITGAARYKAFRHDSFRAFELYGRLQGHLPADADIQAAFGRTLFETGRAEEFIRWQAQLPASISDDAEVWSARGRFAQLRSEPDHAIRCFWEAVRHDPNRIEPNMQLGVMLPQHGRNGDAKAFETRARQLKSLVSAYGTILADDSRIDYLVRTAELTESLGRLWEARGWYLLADRRTNDSTIRANFDRLTAMITNDTPQTLPDANPASKVDLSSFELPRWIPGSSKGERVGNASGSRWMPQVTFADQAAAAGVDFTYFNGDDPELPGIRIFQSTGGGVAAFDYDGDLWPDLYFTQGGDWPVQEGQTRYLDRLFRNLGNGRFADVTRDSGLGDASFSQGVAAGDVNDDGFPDLYVGNIGQNRLYLNHGDGTFSDVTAEAGLRGGDWTTSVAIADLNGDGFAEIYDVTYLAGEEPFRHICHDLVQKDSPRICAPKVFPAEQDRLYLNRGDGSFADVSSQAGIHAPEGKGLGIVVADLDGSRRLSLYVANDQTPCFLFLNQTAAPGSPPNFIEQAGVAGCATDAEGHAGAAMGIAVDDYDGGGLIDLFVSNFHNEYDVLYRQIAPGTFMDVSSDARLKQPTSAMLGFGTQFLDGDLDGWPDLVLANGNVEDYRSMGVPFRMRGQYFANLGNGRFAELPGDQAGDYFCTEQLGRGMARLDWNRDGRDDFAVSNLDTRASLVTNTSAETGHFLVVQLRGVHSNRDAIGTSVVARVSGRTIVKQLTAGDGYQASNQRQVVFGLADDTSADELLIRWPSGQDQSFQQVQGDCEYLAIEGRPGLVRLPAP